MMSPKIFLIRHAEKPDPTSAGVSVNGTPNEKALTVRGWQRAGALVCFFAGPNTPRYLFASHSSSDRPRQTLLPLSEKLGIPIDMQYGKRDEDLLAARAKACGGMVLICWQHQYMAAVANAILGNHSLAPQRWSEDRFDMVWIFDLDLATGNYGFRQVPEHLLAGDSTQPI